MSNQNSDAFGHTPPAPQHHDHAEDSDQPGDQVSDAKPKSPAFPLPAKIGVGVFGLVFLVIIGASISNFMQRRAQAPAPLGQASAPVDSDFEQAVRNEILTIKQSITAIQEAQASLNRLVAQNAANKPRDTEGLIQRVVTVERALNALHANVKTLASRSMTERPLEFELARREDARIVSIGNGVVRIALTSGKEITLQKGDKFNGLVVRQLMPDRRVVVLSDGSVIL